MATETKGDGPAGCAAAAGAAAHAAVEGQRGRAAGPPAPSRVALRSRTFVIFLAGSVVSWVGDWMDLVTLNWTVMELTDSPFNIGLTNACRLIPVFLLSVPAGVLADRLDRKSLLMWLQVGLMLMTFVVGALVAARAPFWLFLVVVTLRSVVAAMVNPVRHALLSNLVPAVALPSAVATQSAGMNLARIVGPAAAGFLLLFLPLQSLFWINGASFLVVIASLWAVRPLPADGEERARGNGGSVSVVGYIRGNAVIQSLLILAVVPMVFGFPYASLMPVFIRDMMNLGPAHLGVLLSLAAVGALLASAWLSCGPKVESVGVWLIVSILGFGLGLVLFTLSPSFYLSAAVIFVVGTMSQFYRTMSRITIQVQVPDFMRGRILSIAMMDRGFIPLGTLFLGALAEWGGPQLMGLVMGGGCVAVTLLVVALRPQIWSMGNEAREWSPAAEQSVPPPPGVSEIRPEPVGGR